MKKILIFALAFAAYANAGMWTYAQANSAKHAARDAEAAAQRTDQHVKELEQQVKELSDKLRAANVSISVMYDKIDRIDSLMTIFVERQTKKKK